MPKAGVKSYKQDANKNQNIYLITGYNNHL